VAAHPEIELQPPSPAPAPAAPVADRPAPHVAAPGGVRAMTSPVRAILEVEE
jgi:hypothetical protein